MTCKSDSYNGTERRASRSHEGADPSSARPPLVAHAVRTQSLPHAPQVSFLQQKNDTFFSCVLCQLERNSFVRLKIKFHISSKNVSAAVEKHFISIKNLRNSRSQQYIFVRTRFCLRREMFEACSHRVRQVLQGRCTRVDWCWVQSNMALLFW